MYMFRIMGPFGFILVILAIVTVALSLRAAARVARHKDIDGPAFKNSLNAILFWGCVSAALGLLGQFSGMWNALGVISKASAISPALVAQGLMESFSTTIFGLLILVVSSISWFSLRTLALRTQTAK